VPAISDLASSLAVAITEISEVGAGTSVPNAEVGRVAKTGPDSLLLDSGFVPNWTAALTSMTPAYLQLDSSKEAVSKLRQSLKGSELERLPQVPQGIFFVFARTYFERAEEFAWKASEFERTLDELERFLALESYLEVRWIPLLNCRMARGLKVVDLTETARIRAATSQDQEDLWNAWSPHSVGVADLHFECLLEIKLPAMTAGAQSLGADVEQALRLVADSSVSILLTWSRPDPEAGPFASVIAENSLHRRHGRVVQAKKLVIGKRIARDLPGLLVRCQAAGADAVFNFAYRRFGFAFDREQIEDRIIDCWVAFEALFLPEESGELSYRAAMRIARFVGSTRAERLQLRKTLRDSYNLRSLVAHGRDTTASKSAKKLKPGELTAETQEILRRSLLLCTDPLLSRAPDYLDAALLA
jgi:hypothetical protein